MGKNTLKREKEYARLSKSLDEHFNDLSQYSYFDKLYNDIKVRYLEKIEQGNFDIKIEKARLQSKAGNFVGNSTMFSINMIILAITLLGTGVIQAYSVMKSDCASTIVILVAFAFFGYIVFIVVKDYKSRDMDFVSHFCIHVLEDIEKEMYSKALNAENLIASTLEKEDAKRYNSEGNYNINISLPDAVSIVSSVVKSGRIFRRIFRKKK